MKGVRCSPAMGGWIRQRLNDLHLLDDRAGPAMRDDHRQRIFMLRTNVNKVNVEAIDLGNEVRHGLQFRLALAPVVVGSPIAGEFLHRCELHSLRCVRDLFSIRPLGRVDAPPQISEFGIWKVELKRTYGSFVCLLAGWLCSTALSHGVILPHIPGFRICKCLSDRTRTESEGETKHRTLEKSPARSVVRLCHGGSPFAR